MNESLGVFLSRMQPLHKGHLGMIGKALSENDRVLILIGSSNKSGLERNPINITLRREILEEALKEEFTKEERKRIIIKEIPDWSTEDDFASNLEWGRYLYYNIVSETGTKNFTMYFSDKPEIIEDWFQDKLIRPRINLKLFERSNMFNAISSTKIREAFLEDNMEYIKDSVPNAVLKRYEELEKIIKAKP